MVSNSEPFWLGLSHSHRLALTEGNISLTYHELAQQVQEVCEWVGTHLGNATVEKKLVLFKFSPSIKSIVRYLSLLASGHAILVVDPTMHEEKISHLIGNYRPFAMWNGKDWSLTNQVSGAIASELALLLPTSGSTGSAKMVALSHQNIQSNAQSICGYLPITETDTTLGTLPLSYSYGLSVLHTHLLMRAHFCISQFTLMESGFWEQLNSKRITSIAGVPQWYTMLLRLGFTRKEWPHLRYFTQAGGKLPESAGKALAEFAQLHSKQFFIMYGQTEATARMAFLSPERVSLKPTSIGQVIPNGELFLKDEAGKSIPSTHTSGELCYSGPNVMLGYVQNANDLALFSPLGTLATGDIGYCDEEGDFFITGRKSRYAKINGLRISMDEIEIWLSKKGITCAVVCHDDVILIAHEDFEDIALVQQSLSDYLGINKNLVRFSVVSQLPLLPNSKVDYVNVKRVLGVE